LNPANSGKVLKINALYVSNVDGTNNAEIDAYLYGNEVNSGFDRSAFSYDSVSFSRASQFTSSCNGLEFSHDGTKMFIGEGSNTSSYYEYDLSTPWDLSTASYTNNSYQISGFQNTTTGIGTRRLRFFDNGNKCLVASVTTDYIHQFSLSTAYDLSTANQVGTLDVSAYSLQPFDMSFGESGSSLFVLDTYGDAVIKYDLSQDYVVSSGTFAEEVTLGSGYWQDIIVQSSGKFWLTEVQYGEEIQEWDFGSDWTLSGMSKAGAVSVATQDNDIESIYIKPDGTKVYVAGSQNDSIYQYTFGATTFDQFHVAKTVSIPANATLDVISKPIYLEEGFSLRLKANLASDLEAVCSYEEIS
jgi:sugar lactone lactonase YvrE